MFDHNSAFVTAMSSARADHDHHIFAREEPIHTFVLTVMYRVVLLGFQNGLHDLRISTNVFAQAPVVVGIVKLSAVNHSY